MINANKIKWNIFSRRNKNKIKSNKIQQLGKTFMLPIAMLAFCGILLGIGASLTGKAQLQQMPWLKTKGVYEFFSFVKTIGLIGFTFLPFLFAMAVPLGLASNNKGVACMSGFIAYASLLFIINFMLNVLPANLVDQNSYMNNAIVYSLGIKTMDLGVLGAILAGIMVLFIHEKCQYIKLPNAIGFWGGRRFVPLITLIIFSIIAIPLTFIWPLLATGIYYIGIGVQKVDWFGPFVYRFIESIIRPTGLHHIVNTTIRFTAVGGSYVSPITNETIVGALNIFYYQLDNGLMIDAKFTRFLSQGYMPTVMFGLPACAIALYFTSHKENKQLVKSVIIPGIVASAIGGITEPIEFLFLFVAPLLYFFHCIMIGLAYMILGLLQVKIGNTDGNLIDFIIFGLMQGLWTRWYYVLVVGVVYAAIYFLVFYFCIKYFNIKIIGRETNQSNENLLFKNQFDLKNKDVILANNIVDLLDGVTNIAAIDNCFTRLRVTLNHQIDLAADQVKKIGAIGLVKINDLNFQIIIGPQVENIKNNIDKIIENYRIENNEEKNI